MPRYVILEHTGTPTYKPGRHWDLMLESDGRLRTWELEATPSHGVQVRALPLEDHRLDYLDYEGPVSKNRGTVGRWDAGEYQAISETEGELTVQVHGQQLRGRLHLQRDSADSGIWWVSFEPG
ncbi:MAG: DNA polymerase ligase N-terminal domain-containing protein [Pirellulales bacterium]